jgi:HK97 family phage major capsid protein
MKTLKEALTRSAEPEIIPSTILNTVVESARKKLIGTQLLALRIGPESMGGDSITLITQTLDSVSVDVVAEGAEIPFDVESYSYFTMTPKKYGVRPLITKEMIEDAKFDVVNRNIEYCGYKMAEKLDFLILEQIALGSAAATGTAHTVSGSTAITLANIVNAMYNLENDGYAPTDMIVTPEVAMDMRQIAEFVHADKSGVTNISQRLIGTIFGMKVWESRNFSSTNIEYAYVIDRDWALCLAEKRPITMERYDDVTRDVTGVVFTARWVARYYVADACAHITLS